MGEEETILKAEGNCVDGDDTHWTVDCPNCDKQFEYTGFFDSSDKETCKCGCVFRTKKIWITDSKYIE